MTETVGVVRQERVIESVMDELYPSGSEGTTGPPLAMKEEVRKIVTISVEAGVAEAIRVTQGALREHGISVQAEPTDRQA